MMNTYGLTSHDLSAAKAKIQKQKDYLESFSFVKDDTGEVKTLLDYSYSANLSKRYYARILNRVHTFVSLGISNFLTPVFLTVTLDGFFRDMMQGDYTRFTPDVIDEYKSHIPNNDRNGYYWDYIRDGSYSDIYTKKSYGKPLTPKDLYKILSHQMHRFTRSKTLQDIRQKFGEDYMMLRVTEPHKDGVPHFHILMYLPDRFIEYVYTEFHRFFPAPRNRKVLSVYDGGRNPDPIVENSPLLETHGFQTQIRSAPAYILKYILKSFRNLVEDKELDYLQAWYIHNKIPRIITTHTLLSQQAFHHFALLENDWFYLTNMKREYSYTSDLLFNHYELKNDKRRFVYKNGLYQYYVGDSLLKQFGQDKSKKIKFTVEFPYCDNLFYKNHKHIIHRHHFSFWRLVPKPKYKYRIYNAKVHHYFNDVPKYEYTNHLDKTLIPVLFDDIDDNIPLYYNPQDSKIDYYDRFLPVGKISTTSLHSWYINFDFDKYSGYKFALIKRELIKRGVLDEIDDFRIDDFNVDSYFNQELVAGGGFEPPTFGL